MTVDILHKLNQIKQSLHEEYYYDDDETDEKDQSNFYSQAERSNNNKKENKKSLNKINSIDTDIRAMEEDFNYFLQRREFYRKTRNNIIHNKFKFWKAKYKIKTNKILSKFIDNPSLNKSENIHKSFSTKNTPNEENSTTYNYPILFSIKNSNQSEYSDSKQFHPKYPSNENQYYPSSSQILDNYSPINRKRSLYSNAPIIIESPSLSNNYQENENSYLKVSKKSIQDKYPNLNFDFMSDSDSESDKINNKNFQTYTMKKFDNLFVNKYNNEKPNSTVNNNDLIEKENNSNTSFKSKKNKEISLYPSPYKQEQNNDNLNSTNNDIKSTKKIRTHSQIEANIIELLKPLNFDSESNSDYDHSENENELKTNKFNCEENENENEDENEDGNENENEFNDKINTNSKPSLYFTNLANPSDQSDNSQEQFNVDEYLQIFNNESKTPKSILKSSKKSQYNSQTTYSTYLTQPIELEAIQTKKDSQIFNRMNETTDSFSKSDDKYYQNEKKFNEKDDENASEVSFDSYSNEESQINSFDENKTNSQYHNNNSIVTSDNNQDESNDGSFDIEAFKRKYNLNVNENHHENEEKGKFNLDDFKKLLNLPTSNDQKDSPNQNQSDKFDFQEMKKKYLS